MKPIKTVYVMTDLEGVAGIDAWDPRNADYGSQAKGVYERQEMQRLLTGEVNAACQGLLDAGVQEILINDCHGAGRTILVEDLIPGVKIVRGLDRPGWLLGISPRFDALVQVGMHSMSNTPHGNLAHTMSPTYDYYRVNGREVGEMELAAFLAGHLGIPWIFTSGDSHACQESETWVPGIVTAPVKEGLSELCAIHLAPVDARNLIRLRIAEAVNKAADIEPLVAQPPVTLDIRRREPGPAEVKPGGERLDAFTVRYSGKDIWTVFNQAHYGTREVLAPV
ncbi:MAG: M55 family metallopeptidase [Anaerolineae bacterium]